jgi:two-component system OmpR family response regulator
MTMNRTKLLLIDDDPVIRAIYRDHFRAAGFEIAMAADGDEGLTLFDQFLPDVVLLDLKMPKLDGLGWLRELRGSKRKQVPVVVLTSADRTQLTAARDADAIYVMRKDVAEPRVVVEAVMTAVDTA